uniref:Transposase (Putative), gypsy type n=1 Tax=Tanacetum cinerariifolium TaxID=118510 RepID=A0A6L2KVT6_TANCI|nr:hypothetical protein [Tanacetum cinerariifolium]
MNGAWVTGRASSYYPVDNRVVALSVGVPPRFHMPCFLLLLVWSRVTICREVVCACGRITFLADMSLPAGRALQLRSGSLLAARTTIYVIMSPQSNVFFVHAVALVTWSTPGHMIPDRCDVSSEMVANSIDTITSVLTQKELDLFYTTYNILAELRPKLLGREDTIKDNMGLLDFVKSVDPFKVKTEERTLAEGEVSLNDKTMNMTVALSIEIIRLVEHIIMDELGAVPATTDGKSPAALKRLELQSGVQSNAIGSASHPTEEFVSSSVTHTPETDVHGDSASTQDETVRGRRVLSKLVVISSSECDEVNAYLKAGSSVPHTVFENVDDDLINRFGTSSAPKSDVGPSTFAPEWHITNDAQLDNVDFYRQFLNHVTPPRYWDALRNQTDVGFPNSFNINFTQHVCMVSELCLRYEHEIRSREKFQKKFTNSSAVVQQRDAEIVALKARFELAKKAAAEVVVLRGHVSELETRELNRHITKLGVECQSLRNKVAGKAKLREEFKSFQDVEARRFKEKYANLDARITDVRHDMDNNLYPHMFTAIAGQRSLTHVEAYDLGVKAKYVTVMHDFENVSFTLLDELESLKDSSRLTLKDDNGNMPLFEVVPAVRVTAEAMGLCRPSRSALGGGAINAPP